MRKTNFSLRLQPSLMEEARQAAESDGISLNQLINVAVAEKLSALRTGEHFQERIRRASRSEPEQTPDRAGNRNPSTESDGLLIGGLPFLRQDEQVQPTPAIGRLPVLMATVTRLLHASREELGVKAQSAPPPDGERAGETGKPAERATPQFGQLKRRLEKTRGR